MNVKIPRDIELYNNFRALACELNDDFLASYAVWRLWMELGYQCIEHSEPGLFLAAEIKTFTGSIKHPRRKEIFDALRKSRFLTARGVNYFCDIFARINWDLNSDWLPDTHKKQARKEMSSKLRIHANTLAGILKKLPEDAWIMADGSRASDEEMNRAVLLIKILDDLLLVRNRYRNEFTRTAEQYTAGLLQTAVRVSQQFTQAKLDMVLRRLLAVCGSKRRTVANFPKDAVQWMADWDKWVTSIMPEEGFVVWDLK